MEASLGAVRLVSQKDPQPSGGLSWMGCGVLCWVEEFTEGVGCSFLPPESVDEPAAGAQEVVRHLLLCRPRPRFRCRGCYAGSWEVLVRIVVEGRRGRGGCGRLPRSSSPLCGVGAGCGGAGMCRPYGDAPCEVCRVPRELPSKVVPEGVDGRSEEAWVAGWGGCGLGCGRCVVVRVALLQWGQWTRRSAAPRQTQWFGLQGRAVCGSRWRTQRGHAVAGGWRYLWTAGGVGAWGFVVCGCWRTFVRCLWWSCVSWSSCVQWMAASCEGVSAPAVRSLGGTLRLVEQEFREVGLVCPR